MPKNSVGSLKCEVFGPKDSQNAESKDAACPNVLHGAHVELSNNRRGKAEDTHVEYDIRHARANIHDWVIRCGCADDLIAPERPD